MLNYLKETLCFLEAVAEEPITPRAQVFWHYLVYANNQAAVKTRTGDYLWPVWFEVDNAVLTRVMGLKNSRGLHYYRKILIERGWVRFMPCLPTCLLLGHPLAADPAARHPGSGYALVPFLPGFRPCPFGKAGGTGEAPVWVSDATLNATGKQVSSYIDINTFLNTVNQIDQLRGLSDPDATSAFDIIAERGRRAALGELYDGPLTGGKDEI